MSFVLIACDIRLNSSRPSSVAWYYPRAWRVARRAWRCWYSTAVLDKDDTPRVRTRARVYARATTQPPRAYTCNQRATACNRRTTSLASYFLCLSILTKPAAAYSLIVAPPQHRIKARRRDPRIVEYARCPPPALIIILIIAPRGPQSLRRRLCEKCELFTVGSKVSLYSHI